MTSIILVEHNKSTKSKILRALVQTKISKKLLDDKDRFNIFWIVFNVFVNYREKFHELYSRV